MKLCLALWLLVFIFEIQARPAKGMCGKEGFTFCPRWIVLHMLYVFLMMFLLVAYFCDVLLTLPWFFLWREQAMNTNLSSKALDSGTLSSTKKSFILFWSRIPYFRQVCQFIIYAHYRKFSVLPKNKIKKRIKVCLFWRIPAEHQFESHAPLTLYLMNFSAVQVLHSEFGGLEQEEEVGSAQPHQDISVFREAKEHQVMRTGWLSSWSHGCCQINSRVSMGSDGTTLPCCAGDMDFKASARAGGAVGDW